MGCGSSSAAANAQWPSAAKHGEPKVNPAETKTEPEKKTDVAEPPKQAESAATNPDSEVAPEEQKKERRYSAKSRVKQTCAPGWLEAAEAYCACLERSEEWPSNANEEALLEVAGTEFEEARKTFESFDVDGDRHVQIDELAAAMEQLGANDGGEITDEIKEMFNEADVNGDGSYRMQCQLTCKLTPSP